MTQVVCAVCDRPFEVSDADAAGELESARHASDAERRRSGRRRAWYCGMGCLNVGRQTWAPAKHRED